MPLATSPGRTSCAKMTTNTLPQIEISSAQDLHIWLASQGAGAGSVLLVTWKKEVPDKYVSTDAVLDELIAFGWIDGRRFKHPDDPRRTLQLITPRQQQAWSKSYKDRAARLIAEGRMQPGGQAAIDAAQQNGLWSFFDDVDALIVPDDLTEMLATDRDRWDGLPPAYRRNVLRWIKLAKTPATRAERIQAATQATREGRRLPQM